MNKFNSFVAGILCCIFLALPVLSLAQEGIQTKTPFDSYFRVTDNLFVYDQSLLSPYNGPDVSHWELLYRDTDSSYDRKRLGIISLTPTQRVYVDNIWDPMSEYFEFRDVNSGKLIQKFEYRGGLNGALLVNGQGAIYQYSTPANMCFGKETKKFIYKNGKLAEVPQPFAYWEDSETTTLENITLYFSPNEKSSQVAALPKGTAVQVLTSNKDGWYLVKTPLGLTGWVVLFIKGSKVTNGSNNTEWLETLNIPICN